MVIEQTVEIPQSHRLTISVPSEIPAGTHKMLIQFPQSEEPEGGGSEDEQRQWLKMMEAVRHAQGAWADKPWENALEEIRAERNACDEADPWKDYPAQGRP